MPEISPSQSLSRSNPFVTYYAVIELYTNKVVYCGHRLQQAAEKLKPGTISAIGDSEQNAIGNARAKAFEIRKNTPAPKYE